MSTIRQRAKRIVSFFFIVNIVVLASIFLGKALGGYYLSNMEKEPNALRTNQMITSRSGNNKKKYYV